MSKTAKGCAMSSVKVIWDHLLANPWLWKHIICQKNISCPAALTAPARWPKTQYRDHDAGGSTPGRRASGKWQWNDQSAALTAQTQVGGSTWRRKQQVSLVHTAAYFGPELPS